MASVSAARKLGILAKVAAQQAGQSRTASAIFKGLRTTATHFAHVLHQLWLEVTGFVFLFIAAIGAGTLTREYTKYHTLHTGGGRLLLAICFTLTFAWFGLSSFWRVHKKANHRFAKLRKS
jgi:hypothetical protein